MVVKRIDYCAKCRSDTTYFAVCLNSCHAGGSVSKKYADVNNSICRVRFDLLFNLREAGAFQMDATHLTINQ
jgi:hypothetical protein